MRILFLIALVAFGVSSCTKFSLQKRKYRKGFHLEMPGKHKRVDQVVSTDTQKKVNSDQVSESVVVHSTQEIIQETEQPVYAGADNIVGICQPNKTKTVIESRRETVSFQKKETIKSDVKSKKAPGNVALWISFILLMLGAMVFFYLVGIIVAVATKATIFLTIALICGLLALLGLVFLILDLVS